MNLTAAIALALIYLLVVLVIVAMQRSSTDPEWVDRPLWKVWAIGILWPILIPLILVAVLAWALWGLGMIAFTGKEPNWW